LLLNLQGTVSLLLEGININMRLLRLKFNSQSTSKEKWSKNKERATR
jgi:hypothetical protein